MLSTSPGVAANNDPSAFVQILPGAPTASLHALATFVFLHKRYIAYITGRQLNILSTPTTLVQALVFSEELVAVSVEITTGKLAVASVEEVYVLQPVAQGWTKVWWEKTLSLKREDGGDEASCLSWGNEGEVLVGGSRQLNLFSTLASSRTNSPADSPLDGDDGVEERRSLWSKSVSSFLQYVAFSPTASLIATCGVHDRLIKIWRRLSFEEGLFDHTYLPHPGAVTHLEWRPLSDHSDERRGSGMSRRQEADAEVLYTVANDGLFRVWRTGGLNDSEILVLHTTVDLVPAIPHSPTLTTNGAGPVQKPSRYVFVLPSDQFCAAVTAAASVRSNGKVSHSLEHLKEVASNAPDVIVTLDGHSRMSAWGLQSIGHKRRPDTPGTTAAFHIAHAEDTTITVPTGSNARFIAWFDDDTLNLLTHTFEHGLIWSKGDVETTFSPSASASERLRDVASWSSGSTVPVSGLRALEDGTVLLSWSESGSITIAALIPEIHKLEQARTMKAGSTVHDALRLRNHKFIVVSDSRRVALLSLDGQPLAKAVHNIGIEGEIGSVRLYELERARSSSATSVTRLLVLNSQTGSCALLAVHVLIQKETQNKIDLQLEFSTGVRDTEVLHAVYADSPRQHEEGQIVEIDVDGCLSKWPLDAIATDKRIQSNTSIQVGVQNPGRLAANHDFAALASSDRKELIIVDLAQGYVEHRQPVSGIIEHLCFSSSRASYTLLAVGYTTTVDVLAQGRYEHHSDPPAWILVKQVSITGIGLQINALEWMLDGTLALATGNGVMITASSVDANAVEREVQDANDIGTGAMAQMEISQLALTIKQPLPVWHPSMLAHLIHQGEAEKASGLLSKLRQKLQFWSEGEPLHPVLDTSIRQLTAPHDSSRDDSDGNEGLVADLLQQLEEKDLPAVSQSEQERLKRVLTAISYCFKHVKGLDRCALRYLFSWKMQMLQMEDANAVQYSASKTNGTSYPSTTVKQAPEMHWREIAFASHSTTQQPLLDILVSYYDEKVTWPIARNLGITAWLMDHEALGNVFESLAQSAYRESSPPDPINASLYFLALHKKPTLIALWRIATWHREQRATTNFLRRDFTQAEAKTAAKKNAYALMGKRRFEYAAAFFLLADDCASAVSVLAGQCEDIMLAVAVARLYAGEASTVVRTLVQDRILSLAKRNGDRWLMSWCHSLLQQRQEAAQALVQVMDGVRTWHQDDPSTLMLYRHMRDKEGVALGTEAEYRAVLRAAKILRRMGLWLLALELVRNWRFTSPVIPPAITTTLAEVNTGTQTANGDTPEHKSVLDGFTETSPPSNRSASPAIFDAVSRESSPAPDDDKAARQAKAAELLRKLQAKKRGGNAGIDQEKKPPPTQFKEPDASSLLESFGF